MVDLETARVRLLAVNPTNSMCKCYFMERNAVREIPVHLMTYIAPSNAQRSSAPLNWSLSAHKFQSLTDHRFGCPRTKIWQLLAENQLTDWQATPSKPIEVVRAAPQEIEDT